MTEHLPECPILKPCCEDEEFPEHGFCGNFVGGRCLHCMAECICDALRACEDRVRKDEQSHFLTRYLLGRNGGGYQRGLDAAREAVAAVEYLPTNPEKMIRSMALDAIDALKEKR